MWHDFARDAVFLDYGHADSDVSELKVESVSWIICLDTTGKGITSDQSIGFDNLFDLHIDEIVERINVLLDETSKSQESWYELPLFLITRTTMLNKEILFTYLYRLKGLVRHVLCVK